MRPSNSHGMMILCGVIIFGISGCYISSSNEGIKQICIDQCNALISEGKNLSSECLINPMSSSDYVCDVAHKPRQAVDNLAENQCSAFKEGKAKHFIEVSPTCKFIRAV